MQTMSLINKLLFALNLTLILLSNVVFANNVCHIRLAIEDTDRIQSNYSVLINGKTLFNANNVEHSIDGIIVRLPINAKLFNSHGNHSIAIYDSDSIGLRLINLQTLFISSNDYYNCHNRENIEPYGQTVYSAGGHSIGVQYSVWHGFASKAVNQMIKNGAQIKTVEKLIELGLSIDDYWSHGVTEADSGNGYYQVQPKQGFYCIYRKRPSDGISIIPECANIENTLANHAQMLSSSGVDYVYVDLTNICVRGAPEDVLQRRPMEVLFEEWHKLRTQGKQTPQIVAWNRIDFHDCTTWRDYLDLYEKYPDLVWRDVKTGKMVFMGTADSDANVKRQIESNNGKNNVVVVNNWVANVNEANAGRWQFMGHCGGQNGQDVTDIVDRNSCDQAVTRNSPIGDQISTGVSYQLNYASSSWGASTSYYGLTFLLQWDTALRVNPQHITISGWNEYFAGAWDNPWKGYAHSLGLNPKDDRMFVDLYGAYRSRDIEPSVEYGNMYYDIMQSCIRVRNMNLNQNRHDCSVKNELCCQLDQHKQFVQVHSLIRNDQQDYLLVNTARERDLALSNGPTGYREVCAYNGATHAFCLAGDPKEVNAGLTGPFIMFDKPGPDRKALYRCKVSDRHFFSTDDKCEKQVTEYLVGYLSTKKDSLFARSFLRCMTAGGIHYHALDGGCHPNDRGEAILGFVI